MIPFWDGSFPLQLAVPYLTRPLFAQEPSPSPFWKYDRQALQCISGETVLNVFKWKEWTNVLKELLALPQLIMSRSANSPPRRIICDQNLLFTGHYGNDCWPWLAYSPYNWDLGETRDSLAETMGEQQKNRGLVAREGSVTRKGREGPAARAAKTHRRRRRRGLEKVARKADPLHRLHPLKGQKFKSEGVGDKVRQKYICWVDRTGIRLKIGLE